MFFMFSSCTVNCQSVSCQCFHGSSWPSQEVLNTETYLFREEPVVSRMQELRPAAPGALHLSAGPVAAAKGLVPTLCQTGFGSGIARRSVPVAGSLLGQRARCRWIPRGSSRYLGDPRCHWFPRQLQMWSQFPQ
jgi:hypothetical protein